MLACFVRGKPGWGGRGKKYWKLEDSAGGRAVDSDTGTGGTRRFSTGRPAQVVIMTFITHKVSRGPWTKTVQGPNI